MIDPIFDGIDVVVARGAINKSEVFPSVSLFKLINVAILFAFHSSSVLQRIWLVSYSTKLHT